MERYKQISNLGGRWRKVQAVMALICPKVALSGSVVRRKSDEWQRVTADDTPYHNNERNNGVREPEYR